MRPRITNTKLLKRDVSIIQCLIFFGMLCFLPSLFPGPVSAQTFTLELAIQEALDANIGLKVAGEELEAAQFVNKASKTNFYPTLSSAYSYKRYNEELRSALAGVTRPLKEYSFSATVSQPLFSGFAILNQYKLSELGLDVAKYKKNIARRDVIFNARAAYFSILKTQKIASVSEQAVKLLDAHLEVATNFHNVGMIPYNDLLKAEVELANARQDFIAAQNSLEFAEANFNTLLRRPINSPVEVEDILNYEPFDRRIDDCIETAEKSREEIRVADLAVDVAQKELEIVKKEYYPSVNLEGTYFRYGTEWDVDGGDGIGDPDGWVVTAVASWNFWEWGRSTYGEKEKLSRVSQATLQKTELLDAISLDVKQAYLKAQESQKNIATVEKAVEQAKENFRISEERYKEQMATTTDVLDAQTLLSKTMTNYYNALYDFKIAKASLYRAMGQDNME